MAGASEPLHSVCSLKLEETLNCPICLEVYTTPKALACLHTFCETCILAHITKLSETGELNGKIYCPVCRVASPPPDSNKPPSDWARLLPMNYAILPILTLVQPSQVPNVTAHQFTPDVIADVIADMTTAMGTEDQNQNQGPVMSVAMLSADAPEFIPKYAQVQQHPHPQPAIQDGLNEYFERLVSIRPPHLQGVMPAGGGAGGQAPEDMFKDAVFHLTSQPGNMEEYIKPVVDRLKCGVTNPSVLSDIIETLFEQSITEPNFRFTGGKICKYLWNELRSHNVFSGFRGQFLIRCKLEYEKRELLIDTDAPRLCGLSMYFGELFLALEVDISGHMSKIGLLRSSIADLVRLMLTRLDDSLIMCATKLLKLTGTALMETKDTLPGNFDDIFVTIKSLERHPSLNKTSHCLVNSVLSRHEYNFGVDQKQSPQKPAPSPQSQQSYTPSFQQDGLNEYFERLVSIRPPHLQGVMPAGGGAGGQAPEDMFKDAVFYLTSQPGNMEEYIKPVVDRLKCGVTNPSVLSDIIETLFEQSITEPNFRFTGGKICKYLSNELRSHHVFSGFRGQFLNRCKLEYEKRELLIDTDAPRLCGLSMYFGELFLALEVDISGHMSKIGLLRSSIADLVRLMLTRLDDSLIMCATKLLKLTGTALMETKDTLPGNFDDIFVTIKSLERHPSLNKTSHCLVNSVLSRHEYNFGVDQKQSPQKPAPSPQSQQSYTPSFQQ